MKRAGVKDNTPHTSSVLFFLFFSSCDCGAGVAKQSKGGICATRACDYMSACTTIMLMQGPYTWDIVREGNEQDFQ